LARTVGADRTVNLSKDRDGLVPFSANKGYFDVLYECSGAQPALVAGIQALRPRGVIVQLGLGGEMSLPMMAITAKELDLRGSFRFHEEFAVAVNLMQGGLIDVKPLITHTLPLANALQAFEIASDKSQSMKTQIAFS
jgi:L-idonate 5-dehydrogenase